MIVIAFKVIILLLIPLTALGVIGEKEDLNLRAQLTGMFLASLVAFIVSQKWL